MSKFLKFIELSFRTLVMQYYYRYLHEKQIGKMNKYIHRDIDKFKKYGKKSLAYVEKRADNHEKIHELQKCFL